MKNIAVLIAVVSLSISVCSAHTRRGHQPKRMPHGAVGAPKNAPSLAKAPGRAASLHAEAGASAAPLPQAAPDVEEAYNPRDIEDLMMLQAQGFAQQPRRPSKKLQSQWAESTADALFDGRDVAAKKARYSRPFVKAVEGLSYDFVVVSADRSGEFGGKKRLQHVYLNERVKAIDHAERSHMPAMDTIWLNKQGTPGRAGAAVEVRFMGNRYHQAVLTEEKLARDARLRRAASTLADVIRRSVANNRTFGDVTRVERLRGEALRVTRRMIRTLELMVERAKARTA